MGNRQQLARPGQARLTQGHTSPLGLISGGHFIFISQMLFVGNSGRWERSLSLSLRWHSDPLSTWRRTVTYDFRPSVWISPLITVMWRRRHLSTVINGAISDWRRMCTTLLPFLQNSTDYLMLAQSCRFGVNCCFIGLTYPAACTWAHVPLTFGHVHRPPP